MKQRLVEWGARFDALSERERIILLVMLVVVILLGWFQFLMEPLGKQKDSLSSEIQTAKSQLQASQKQIELLKPGLSSDLNEAKRQQLQALEIQQAALDAELKEKMQGLISPKQMAQVLEKVLTQKTDLHLEKVQNLPTVPLLEVTAPENNKTDTEASAGVYRHGLQIEFSGSYLSTLEYLKAIKELPWDFYWEGLVLDVDTYPRARVVVTVYTLSLTEGWIGV